MMVVNAQEQNNPLLMAAGVDSHEFQTRRVTRSPTRLMAGRQGLSSLRSFPPPPPHVLANLRNTPFLVFPDCLF